MKTLILFLLVAIFTPMFSDAQSRASGAVSYVYGCQSSDSQHPCPLCRTDLTFELRNPFDSVTMIERRLIDTMDIDSVVYISQTAYTSFDMDSLFLPIINTNTSFAPLSGNEYRFILTVSQLGQTWSDTSYFFIQADCNVAGIREMNAYAGGIGVYPNPASDHATLTVSSDVNSTAEINLLDMAGRKIRALAHNLSVPIGKTETDVDLSELSSGCYFIHYRDLSGRSFSSKIIKQ